MVVHHDMCNFMACDDTQRASHTLLPHRHADILSLLSRQVGNVLLSPACERYLAGIRDD